MALATPTHASAKAAKCIVNSSINQFQKYYEILGPIDIIYIR